MNEKHVQEWDISAWLNETLEAALEGTRAAGASAALLYQGQVFTATAGVLDLESGENVREDAAFQIGSITKLFVTALVLRLTELKLLDLDKPVTFYLPELSDAVWEAGGITLRHILTHTSGLEGDVMDEEEDPPIDLYLQRLKSIPPFAEPGRHFSYCNSGFMIAAKLVETVTGQKWQEAMREYILQPLGLEKMILIADDVEDQFRAHGHIINDDKGFVLERHPDEFALPLNCAPMGSTPMMAARDLLRFASAMFLETESTILSKASRELVMEATLDLPNGAAFGAKQWGIGAAIYDWDGTKVYGHDGDTISFASFLRVEPKSKIALVLFVNGGFSFEIAQPVTAEVFGELLNIRPPQPFHAEESDVTDAQKLLTGTYERLGQQSDVTLKGHQLIYNSPPLTSPLYHESGNIYQLRHPALKWPIRIEFRDFVDGVPQSLFRGFRLSKRTTD